MTATIVICVAAGIVVLLLVALTLIDVQHREHTNALHIFDADGTLWPGDVAETFLKWRDLVKGSSWQQSYAVVNATHGYQRGFPWVEEMMAKVPQVRREVDDFVFWADVHAPDLQLFPSMRRRLDCLQSSSIVVVSASPERLVAAWLSHVYRRGGIRIVGMRADGMTGRVPPSRSPFRAGKAAIIERLALESGCAVASATGNSWTDYEMLLWASDVHDAQVTVINPSTDRSATSYGSLLDVVSVQRGRGAWTVRWLPS